MIDSVNSCPLFVNLYSTLGGISLYDCLLKIPFLSSSFNLIARVLLLNPFIEFLNFRYRTGSLEQHNGIRISSVPLLVISFLIELFLSLNSQCHIPENYRFHFCGRGNSENSFLWLSFFFSKITLSFCFSDFTYFT